MFPPCVVAGTPAAATSGERVVPSILMEALTAGADVEEADAPRLTLAASSRSDGAAVAAAGEVVKRTWPVPNVSKVVVAGVLDEVMTRACEKCDELLARVVDGIGRGVESNAGCPTWAPRVRQEAPITSDRMRSTRPAIVPPSRIGVIVAALGDFGSSSDRQLDGSTPIDGPAWARATLVLAVRLASKPTIKATLRMQRAMKQRIRNPRPKDSPPPGGCDLYTVMASSAPGKAAQGEAT
jgi:hypothetical protein